MFNGKKTQERYNIYIMLYYIYHREITMKLFNICTAALIIKFVKCFKSFSDLTLFCSSYFLLMLFYVILLILLLSCLSLWCRVWLTVGFVVKNVNIFNTLG